MGPKAFVPREEIAGEVDSRFLDSWVNAQLDNLIFAGFFWKLHSSAVCLNS